MGCRRFLLTTTLVIFQMGSPEEQEKQQQKEGKEKEKEEQEMREEADHAKWFSRRDYQLPSPEELTPLTKMGSTKERPFTDRNRCRLQQITNYDEQMHKTLI
ncbi:hypothetical protein MRB53_022215 [Persea americana]|uniref:Uncharacterized protein n=1 Tax=Persea americana TaxID=3435 RepID=A0ACC2L718_PERAE|nr:hypothetical protein MRB53_022215 [Persea americana]